MLIRFAQFLVCVCFFISSIPQSTPAHRLHVPQFVSSQAATSHRRGAFGPPRTARTVLRSNAASAPSFSAQNRRTLQSQTAAANSSSTSVWLTSPSPRRSAAAPPAQLPAHALTLRPLFGLVLLLLSLPFPSFLVLLFSLLSSLFSLPPSPSSSVLLLFLSHCSPLLPPSTPPLLANAGESLQLVEAPANARAECARMA